MDYHADNDGEETWSDSGCTVRVAETKVDWMRTGEKKKRIKDDSKAFGASKRRQQERRTEEDQV